MKKLLVCLLVVFAAANAFPQVRYNLRDFRLRRQTPRASLMVGRYYGRPIKRNTEYIPPVQNGMSAFVVGDTVGTNSYSGIGSYNPDPNIIEGADSFESEVTEKIVQNNVYNSPVDEFTSTPLPIEITEAAAEEILHSVEATTVRESPKRRPPSKPASTVTAPSKEEDEEEEQDGGFWPFNSNGRGQSVYNAFFPISLGSLSGRSRVKSYEGSEDLPSPGAATAIANSFSTGKGGVATSHATSYGDPYLSTLLRSGFSFNKNKNLQLEAV